MDLEIIMEWAQTAEIAWYGISALILIGLVIWRINNRNKEDFERREF